MKRIATVECRFTVEVEIPFRHGYDAKFDIEENHCPGTGLVGLAIEKAIADSDKAGTCWACPGGENKIISIRDEE